MEELMPIHDQIKQEYKKGPVQFTMNVATVIMIVGTLLFSASNSLVFKKPFDEMCRKLDTFMAAQASENTRVSDSLVINAYNHEKMLNKLSIYTAKQEKIENKIITITGKPIE
jgi:hypothetical protein